MTAPAVALPPIDPAPAPTKAQAPAGGSQFLALLAPSTAAAAVPSSTPAAASGNATKPTLVPAATNASGRKAAGANQVDGSDPTNGARATSVVIPLPLPVLLTQPLPSLPSAAAPSTPGLLAPAAVLPAAPQATPATAPAPINLAAALLGSTALNVAHNGLAGSQSAPAPLPGGSVLAQARPTVAAPLPGAPQPGVQQANVSITVAAGAAAAPAAGTASAAAGSATATAPPAQPLPAMAATLGMRLAASAANLVSQPSVALASIASGGDSKTATKAAANGADAAANRSLTLSDTAHALAKPVLSPTLEDPAGIAPNALKEAGALAPAPGHDGAAGEGPQPGATPAPQPSPTATPPLAMTTAPAAAAPTASAPLALVPHVVSEQVAVTLRQAVREGSDHIQIQLQPADLGAVEVKLNINHDGRVTMVVSADRSDTLNLLQQDASGLAQALRDAGLQADNSSLSFNLRGGYQFQQQHYADSGSAALDGDAGSAADDRGTVAARPALARHNGSLDIQV